MPELIRRFCFCVLTACLSLVVNTFAGHIAKPSERTVLFGRLEGGIMLGMALGLWRKQRTPDYCYRNY
jgi:hypothetical protein